ncbi:cupin domain-containing protein [Frankia sp. EI5c]|uniref:cupin domain-containing protein n=1 Tax=Frankia sp. EI5c TaxID=683316 RepID=UPI0007C2A369|nr:cupin domain-containing protein [Frankia sp. EI5c]OAA18968.1 cupin domain-containing protein [Frankia sp. EI5c]
MSDPVVTEFPSGCRVVSGGLDADNSAAAAGGSGGLARGSALAEGGMWLGISELPAGHASTLHHHDGQATIVYLIRGEMTFLVDRADGRTDEFTARAGEIAAIPGGLNHREENRGGEPCLCVVVRNADQPRVVNIE